MSEHKILRLMGRCTNGCEADGGSRYHAVPLGEYRALCGAEPGRRSAGWANHPDSHGDTVTCPKCIRKLARKPAGNNPAAE